MVDLLNMRLETLWKLYFKTLATTSDGALDKNCQGNENLASCFGLDTVETSSSFEKTDWLFSRPWFAM